MKPLYSEQEFKLATSRQRLLCECILCGKSFSKPKHDIQSYLAGRLGSVGRTIDFCSSKCQRTSTRNRVVIPCKQCKIECQKWPKEIKNSKSGNVFCSQSCAAKWNNAHKTKGTRVSKLERWLAIKLPELYPNLEFRFNRTDAINAELDIFVPSLKLAFELNGVFHYEPIYGPEKLSRIRSNDDRKFQACLERGIELCILDVSRMLKFKSNKAEMFLEIINKIITIQLSKNNPSTGASDQS